MSFSVCTAAAPVLPFTVRLPDWLVVVVWPSAVTDCDAPTPSCNAENGLAAPEPPCGRPLCLSSVGSRPLAKLTTGARSLPNVVPARPAGSGPRMPDRPAVRPLMPMSLLDGASVANPTLCPGVENARSTRLVGSTTELALKTCASGERLETVLGSKYAEQPIPSGNWPVTAGSKPWNGAGR